MRALILNYYEGQVLCVDLPSGIKTSSEAQYYLETLPCWTDDMDYYIVYGGSIKVEYATIQDDNFVTTGKVVEL